MKVTIKKQLPKSLFEDRLALAGKTLPITGVVINGQTWPVELLEDTKGDTR